MLPSAGIQHASARRPRDEAELDQIGFDHLFERVARLRKPRRQRLDAHRAALVDVGDHAEIAPVHRIQPERIDLPPFTLIGATTRQGLLTTPLRDRFGIPVRLNFYTVEELESVVARGARLLGMGMDPAGGREIARRARGTPRVAGRLLRRVRDFAHVAGADVVNARIADEALTRLEVDSLGLDAMDRRYLTMIADIYKGGPVGVETLAAGLAEPRDTIEEVVEPYLIQLGLLARTARGRCLNDRGWTHLGLSPPAGPQAGLFDAEG